MFREDFYPGISFFPGQSIMRWLDRFWVNSALSQKLFLRIKSLACVPEKKFEWSLSFKKIGRIKRGRKSRYRKIFLGKNFLWKSFMKIANFYIFYWNFPKYETNIFVSVIFIGIFQFFTSMSTEKIFKKISININGQFKAMQTYIQTRCQK